MLVQERELEDVGLGALIPFYLAYIKNHKYFSSKNIVSSFLEECFNNEREEANFFEEKKRLGIAIGRITEKLKDLEIIQKFNSKTYITNKKVERLGLKELYEQFTKTF